MSYFFFCFTTDVVSSVDVKKEAEIPETEAKEQHKKTWEGENQSLKGTQPDSLSIKSCYIV